MNNPAGMTRRRFLEAGMAGGAALVLAGPAGGAEAPRRVVRLGFVGMGGRGTALLSTLLEVRGVEVRAVCDLLAERTGQAQRIVEQKGGQRPEAYVKGDTGWRGLVEREDLDAVINATPWEWHTPVAVAAMRAGKVAAVEVPAAVTLEECWQLVRASEETGRPCMMLENVCYFQNVLCLLRMVREGRFGPLVHCEGGYQHDCRSLMFDAQGRLTWRGRYVAGKNGNLYPTHPLGPIAHWLDINRGDRFTQLTSVSTAALGLRQYAAEKLGRDHELARRAYAQGDVNTTLLKTENGRTVTLYFDMMTHRPYDLILRLQGVNGIYLGTHDRICLAGANSAAEQWEPFEPYLEKYAHPLWEALAAKARQTGGHGGSDYVMLHDFVEAVRARAPLPQDVYDAATWSAVFPLSIQSVARGRPEPFPDFTRGKWKRTPPLPIRGA